MSAAYQMTMFLALAVIVAVPNCVLGCPPTPTPAPVPNKPPSFIGCFEDYDKGDTQDMERYHTIYHTRDFEKDCESKCRETKMQYFAVRRPFLCFCGNKYGRHGQVEVAQCNVTCPSGPGRCGGKQGEYGTKWRNSVFKINY